MLKAHFCHQLCNNSLLGGLTIVLWLVLAMLAAVLRTLPLSEAFRTGSDHIDE
jgi:hypothetical protein